MWLWETFSMATNCPESLELGNKSLKVKVTKWPRMWACDIGMREKIVKARVLWIDIEKKECGNTVSYITNIKLNDVAATDKVMKCWDMASYEKEWNNVKSTQKMLRNWLMAPMMWLNIRSTWILRIRRPLKPTTKIVGISLSSLRKNDKSNHHLTIVWKFPFDITVTSLPI